VENDIHFQQQEFVAMSSKRPYGCVICNPPYGERIGEAQDIKLLYASMPDVLRRLKTWSHFILTAYPDFESLLGQQADKRRKLFNGPIECTYYQFYGPRPPKEGERAPKAETVESAFGGLSEKAYPQAEAFRNRLIKWAHHLRKWPARGIPCYRLYDRDIPEVPLAVDRYEDCLHLAEYDRPNDHTAAEHADWLDLMTKTAGQALGVPKENVFLKRRERQRGLNQYEKFDETSREIVVQEGGLKFKVNLSDYLDTGLFLDHRITRDMVRKEAKGCRVLNLFCYTGSFTVYAADGGAASTTSVDLSNTYLQWAGVNLALNGMGAGKHDLVRSDVMDFLRYQPSDLVFDLAVVDPPTFSNSKQTVEDWDVQRDYVELLNQVLARMTPGGIVYFSTNYRRFKMDESLFDVQEFREISNKTVPEDFRNKRIHRCWRIVTKY
jgi:23S rRNA (guanine2445-N2)-methyltransferase / 23S rRNA (guanine2069-N7)-methyltransferase